MARARLLECMVENTKLEEEIEDPAWVAHLALEAATEAVDLSLHTENRRLQARALIWHGLTICNTSGRSSSGARRETWTPPGNCASARAAAQERGTGSHLGGSPDAQESRGGRRQSGCAAAGVVAGRRGRTQLPAADRRFCRSGHPKVWEHEGRKVARVARRLAISPKKVRRVLARLGLHGDRFARQASS